MRTLPLLVWLASSAPLFAQAVSEDVIRLSPVEREAAIESATGRADHDLPINGLSRGPHGEMGVAVDSRGGHAIYGTTAIPLGQTGSAAFSFEQADSGRWHPR